MPTFRYDPPIPKNPGILQTVSLLEDGRPIGSARWHAAADDTEGIVQILDFEIDLNQRRRGNGKRLLAALAEQCQLYHRTHKKTFRRLWLTLGHKRHVIARAFFLSQGFTHVSTIKDIARDEDLLAYVRSFD